MGKARFDGGSWRLAVSVGLLVGMAVPPPADAANTGGVSKAIKCWHNNDGVRECGNAIPPEYAQQQTEVKDKQGVTIQTQGRAKTQEELEAERVIAKAKADELSAQKATQAEDRVLLDTYSSEDDLILSRDGQVNHLDSQVRLTKTHITKLQKNLDQSIERAAESERKGEKPSKELTDNIDSVRRQIADNEKFIDTKHKEQQEILDRFNVNIKRFRALKGLPLDKPIPDVTPPAPAAPPDFSKIEKAAAKVKNKKK